MLYDAQGNPVVDETKPEVNDPLQDIPLFNVPPFTPKPEWFDRRVNETFGYADGDRKIPKYRVVWGMDETNLVFAMGKLRMKYPTVMDTIQEVVGYRVYNTVSGQHNDLTVEKAHARYYDHHTNQMTRNVKPYELLSPIMREREIEIGSPWWVVEQFVKPEHIGTRDQWNNERWMMNPFNAKENIDCLGPYPENGCYMQWFDILSADDEGNWEYRPLDESVIDWIQANHVANIARVKKLETVSITKQREQKIDNHRQMWGKQQPDMIKQMLDIKKNRRFNITPKG